MVAGVRRLLFATGNSDPANIAVLCVGFLQYGCAQAIGLRAAGLKVTLYYVFRDNEFASSQSDRMLFLEQARASGVELIQVPRRRLRSLLSQTLWLHRDLRRRRIAAAVVQSHVDPRYATLGIALPAALVLHDPVIHSGDTLSTFPRHVRAMRRVVELTSACLIIHSERLLEQVQPLLRKLPIAVVPHGAYLASSPAPVPPARRLLIFGRLFEYKGVDTALDAFGMLPPEMSDVTLTIAGRGPLATRARGQHNVELREEYITESDIDALLGEIRLVLLPYKDATQSGVGMRAIGHGIPCIVSSAGGLPELVECVSSSLIVPPNDPQRVADAIVAHIDHGDDLRRALYNNTVSRFAWPVVARQLVGELRRLGIELAEVSP